MKQKTVVYTCLFCGKRTTEKANHPLEIGGFRTCPDCCREIDRESVKKTFRNKFKSNIITRNAIKTKNQKDQCDRH